MHVLCLVAGDESRHHHFEPDTAWLPKHKNVKSQVLTDKVMLTMFCLLWWAFAVWAYEVQWSTIMTTVTKWFNDQAKSFFVDDICSEVHV